MSKAWYDRLSGLTQQGNAKEVERFASLIPRSPRLRVCDIGCAEGKLAAALATSHAVTACDISERYLEAVPDDLGIVKVCCDVEESIGPFWDLEFDAVFLMDVVEHFKSPFRALSNIRGLLAPKGVLFINTPNVMSYHNFVRHILKPRGSGGFFRLDRLTDLHLSVFDFWGLEKLLNFVGFDAELLTHYFAPNLLVRAVKSTPIDVDRQIDFWIMQRKALDRRDRRKGGI